MTSTKAHCNQCSGDRNHTVLHLEETRWSNDEACISGGDKYEMLKCMGCDNIALRHTSWNSEDDERPVNYFPPAIFRPSPAWFADLRLELSPQDKFVEPLLREIYVALQNNQPRLAAIGIRSLLENVMIAKTTDQGTFGKNIAEFERLGYVSKVQRERLETIIDAGHAATHRAFLPSNEDVITLVNIAEHIIESVYLHETKIDDLKSRVPPKKTPPRG